MSLEDCAKICHEANRAYWRPKAGRRRGTNSRTRTTESGGPRPETSELVQCGKCSAELPEGKDRRSRCEKCGAKAWEVVPARHAQLADGGEEDDE